MPERSLSGKKLEIKVGELPNGQKLTTNTRKEGVYAN